MLSSKWWLGLFGLYVMIATLCLVTEGGFVGSNELGRFNEITSGGWGTPGNIFGIVFDTVTWNFAYFETGFGIYLKIPLMCLSAAVIIPLAFEVFRLIFKPFGG